MSSSLAIETLVHEARVHQIQGDRETAIKCYMTVVSTIPSVLEKCGPEERTVLETTLANVKKELELVRSIEEKPETQEASQPVYEPLPSDSGSVTDDSLSTNSLSTIASVPNENGASVPTTKRSFKERCRVFFKRPHVIRSEKSATHSKSCVFSKVGSFFCAIWNGILVFIRCNIVFFTQFFSIWKGVFTRAKPTK